MLAYAGLPLTADDIVVSEPSTKPPQPEKRTVSAGNDTDVKKIFSRAALDAIEDDHRLRHGNQGHAFGPAESFYVVQKGGGTYSYAEIAKAQQSPSQPGSSNPGDREDDDDDNDDDVVDDDLDGLCAAASAVAAADAAEACASYCLRGRMSSSSSSSSSSDSSRIS